MLITRPGQPAGQRVAEHLHVAGQHHELHLEAVHELAAARASAAGLVSRRHGHVEERDAVPLDERSWSRWLETTATMSMGRSPARARKSRSLRQWANLDTMISTRARPVLAELEAHAEPLGHAGQGSVRRASAVEARPPWRRRRVHAHEEVAETLVVELVELPMLRPCSRSTPTDGVARSPVARGSRGSAPSSVVGGAVGDGLRLAGAASALDDVDGEATARGLLVLDLHVAAGLAHRLDDLVEGDLVVPVAVEGRAGRR